MLETIESSLRDCDRFLGAVSSGLSGRAGGRWAITASSPSSSSSGGAQREMTTHCSASRGSDASSHSTISNQVREGLQLRWPRMGIVSQPSPSGRWSGVGGAGATQSGASDRRGQEGLSDCRGRPRSPQPTRRSPGPQPTRPAMPRPSPPGHCTDASSQSP
jgi:hypothetical protein